jgi:Na+/proline symporter
MVATTFAADTPLAVTELVAANGIAGNWLWWNAALGGMLTVFFFARLWRRSGVITDVEFVELRYAGPAASWLRGIKAVYFGLLMNVIILGWVSLAMETVLRVLFPELQLFGASEFTMLGMTFSAHLALVGGLIVIVAIYSLLAGLWGVAATDLMQFVVAMTGSVVLAVYALDHPSVGGISGLIDRLPASTFDFLPTVGTSIQGAGVLALSISAFVAYLGVQWWSSWYPGAEPGGGGYVAQRMMSARDEKHSFLATLWFTIAHYCIRPWPWIIVALASVVVYPGLADARDGYVMVMRDVLPSGLLGLLFAAFLAAFMSTVSTQLNWLVNDFWRRFVVRDGSESHYVYVARLMTFVLGVFAFVITTQLDSISRAWALVLTASAGLGLVLILRWYWWRINAWSELTATLVPIVLTALSLFGIPVPGLLAPFPTNLFAVVAITTVAWVLVTIFTTPTPHAHLQKFYRAVRPTGPGWKSFSDEAEAPEIDNLGVLTLNWLAGSVLVYMALFGVGNALFRRYTSALICLAIAFGTGIYLYRSLAKRGFRFADESPRAETSGESRP